MKPWRSTAVFWFAVLREDMWTVYEMASFGPGLGIPVPIPGSPGSPGQVKYTGAGGRGAWHPPSLFLGALLGSCSALRLERLVASTPSPLCLFAGSTSPLCLCVGSPSPSALRVCTPSPLVLCGGSSSPVALCAGSSSPFCLCVGSLWGSSSLRVSNKFLFQRSAL